MTLNLLDVVILQRDLPEHGLAAGDLGTIVELYGDTAADVEFVRASGRTQALVELAISDLREVGDADLLTVRQVESKSIGHSVRWTTAPRSAILCSKNTAPTPETAMP